MKILFRSIYHFEVQIAQTKLESRGIPSYIKNEYVNNVAVMPVAENYILLIDEQHYDEALRILEEEVELGDEESD